MTKNNSQRLALVVDDERTNRIMLGALLKRLDFELAEASDGLEAVELFKARRPDIVFMDVMMPRMDGYEATRQIKVLAGDDFVPVMFLSALDDEQSLARGIEAGGDDFLTKPYSKTVLSHKIHAMKRIYDLQRKTRQMFAQIQRDQEIAEAVFSRAVLSGNLDLPKLRTLLRPATLFSGDVVLTAKTPVGDINLLLGDFTGHGLAAALGALPVSEVFRAMSAKGFSLAQTIATINRKLCHLLPVGMFFAGIFVQIDHGSNVIVVYNFGMPDAVLRDGQTGALRTLLPSMSFPLGITEDLKVEPVMQRIRVQAGDSLILTTDGVVDARNPEGEFFGYPRLKEAILACPIGQDVTAALGQALEQFCQEAPQDDDISMVEMPLTATMLPNSELTIPVLHHPASEDVSFIKTLGRECLNIDMTIFPYHLRQGIDPIPFLITQIDEIEHLGAQRGTFFTILTELFVNAVDHGLLRLDSICKAGDNGFETYLSERAKRLQKLEEGFVRIRLRSLRDDGQSSHEGGLILIEVEDSGMGFDHCALLTQDGLNNPLRLSGRGIHLVRELTRSVQYQGCGNRVVVTFVWSHS